MRGSRSRSKYLRCEHPEGAFFSSLFLDSDSVTVRMQPERCSTNMTPNAYDTLIATV